MKNLKVLHITDFHLRHSSRLYYSTARKLNNGFIRNNFYVNELSERDFDKKLFFFDNKNYNKKIIEIIENLNPALIVLGHCTRINFQTFEYIKKIHPDITFLIDLNNKESKIRISNRSKKTNKFDKLSSYHFNKIRNGFLKISKMYKNKIVLIKGNKSLNEIQKVINKKTLKILNERL